MLFNLTVNARDAMPDGGTLTIATREAELTEVDAVRHHGVTAGHYVELEISDTGTGMSPGVAARIFEPFFTTKSTGEGTGLGLATVHGIVSQARGSCYAAGDLGTDEADPEFIQKPFTAEALGAKVRAALSTTPA